MRRERRGEVKSEELRGKSVGTRASARGKARSKKARSKKCGSGASAATCKQTKNLTQRRRDTENETLKAMETRFAGIEKLQATKGTKNTKDGKKVSRRDAGDTESFRQDLQDYQDFWVKTACFSAISHAVPFHPSRKLRPDGSGRPEKNARGRNARAFGGTGDIASAVVRRRRGRPSIPCRSGGRGPGSYRSRGRKPRRSRRRWRW